MTTAKQPDITVYFLGASRAIRIPWQLEELGVPYKIIAEDRAPNGVASPEFKAKNPAPLKKFPTITDGDIAVQESGAIVQYIEDFYDPQHKLLPQDPATRAQCYEFLHGAEGAFMLHGLAILYARWRLPEAAHAHLPAFEQGLSANVINDFNWIESALSAQKSKGREWLVGESFSVADIMTNFSVEFLTTRKLGVGADWEEKYPCTKEWLARTMQRDGYKRAVERSGYTLESHGKFRT